MRFDKSAPMFFTVCNTYVLNHATFQLWIANNENIHNGDEVRFRKLWSKIEN